MKAVPLSTSSRSRCVGEFAGEARLEQHVPYPQGHRAPVHDVRADKRALVPLQPDCARAAAQRQERDNRTERAGPVQKAVHRDSGDRDGGCPS